MSTPPAMQSNFWMEGCGVEGHKEETYIVINFTKLKCHPNYMVSVLLHIN